MIGVQGIKYDGDTINKVFPNLSLVDTRYDDNSINNVSLSITEFTDALTR